MRVAQGLHGAVMLLLDLAEQSEVCGRGAFSVSATFFDRHAIGLFGGDSPRRGVELPTASPNRRCR